MSDPETDSPQRPANARRGSKPVTVTRLEHAAASYLARYDTSSARLRAVLMRRVRNARRNDVPVVADAEAVIERIVARHVGNGIVDDSRYAERRAGSLHRRGVSTRHIREKLKLAGIAREGADQALDATRADLDLDEATLDLHAAVALARRRRLGPFRAGEDRADRRDRDLAALARAGFAFHIARRVIDADDPEILLAEDAGS